MTLTKKSKTIPKATAPAKAAKPPKPASPTADSPKVFDVAKPGRSAATATAKPVIVANRQIMADPMVSVTADSTPDAPLLKTPSAAKLVIKPLHDHIKPETTTPDPAPAKPKAKATPPKGDLTAALPTKIELVDNGDGAATKAAKTAKPAAKAKSQPPADDGAESIAVTVKTAPKVAPVEQAVPTAAPASPQTPPAEPPAAKPVEAAMPETTPPDLHPSDAGTSMDIKQPVDKSASAADKTDAQLAPAAVEAVDKEAAERAVLVQKLVHGQRYFLPINSVEQRRTKRVMLLGGLLIIVLAAAWYDVALDANLLPNTYHVQHTHFFSLKK